MVAKALKTLAIVALTLLLADYCRLRFFAAPSSDFKDVAVRCLDFAAQQVKQVGESGAVARACQQQLEDQAQGARRDLATQLRVVDLIRRTSAGDRDARIELETIGWSKGLDRTGRQVAGRTQEFATGVGGP